MVVLKVSMLADLMVKLLVAWMACELENLKVDWRAGCLAAQMVGMKDNLSVAPLVE
jgi:hypothetical protein